MDNFNYDLFKFLKNKLKNIVKIEEGLFEDTFIVTHYHSNNFVFLTKYNVNTYLLAIYNAYDLGCY